MWSSVLETIGASAVLVSLAVQISTWWEPLGLRGTLHRALHAVEKRLLGRMHFARTKPQQVDTDVD
ncbi:hypothetical protein [Paraburkholderia lacunae]|uniref:hypothetical protein n=1 Tax=Paraburkholderia lacunae TaxID=2211104 RepID=UPI0014034EE1